MRQVQIDLAAAPANDVGNSLDQLAYPVLCAFIFVLPWEDTVPLFGGFVISRWLGLLAFGIALLRAGVLAQGQRLAEMHYWMLAFAAWSSASIFWTMDWDSTAARVGTYAQMLVLAWLIWTLTTSEGRVLGLLQSYVFGACICAMGTIANLIAGRSSGQLDGLEGPQVTNSGRYTIEGVNPNDLGLMLALSIPMTLYLLARRKGSLAMTLLCWVQFVLCVTTILLSGSRGSTLAAAVALGMFPFAVVRLPRWQRVLALTACAAALACGAYLVPNDTWQRFFQIGTEMTKGTMTHRTQIWTASMEVFRDHALWGVGSDAHGAAVMNILGRPYGAHNTFLSVLVELGIVGELLLLGLLGAAFHYACRMKGLERALWILTLLTWCIGVCGTTWEYRKTTWFLLSLLVAHFYAQRETGPIGLR
jgi:O-antigen ligase